MTAALIEALRVLADAEQTYRMTTQTLGASHIETGRAWDKMRRAGDKARSALASHEAAMEAPSSAYSQAKDVAARRLGQEEQRVSSQAGECTQADDIGRILDELELMVHKQYLHYSEYVRAKEAIALITRLSRDLEAAQAVNRDNTYILHSQRADLAKLRREAQAMREALRLFRSLVRCGIPRYTVAPGADLNSLIDEKVDPLLASSTSTDREGQ